METSKDLIEFILQEEGFISNNKLDTGGFTIFGISSKHYPNDKIFDMYEAVKHLDTRKQYKILKPYAINFYSRYLRFLPQFTTISFMYSNLAVNTGIRQANKLIQRALNSVVGYNILVIDGIVGKNTLRIYDRYDEYLPIHLYKTAIDFYVSIIVRRPNQSVFIKGWLNRTFKAFKHDIKETCYNSNNKDRGMS